MVAEITMFGAGLFSAFRSPADPRADGRGRLSFPRSRLGPAFALRVGAGYAGG